MDDDVRYELWPLCFKRAKKISDSRWYCDEHFELMTKNRNIEEGEPWPPYFSITYLSSK
jgi:hypothetical protein